MLKKVLLLLVILFIYRSSFALSQTLSSGDWPFLYLENIKEFSFLPHGRFFWIDPYYQITSKLLVEYLGFNWNFAEKLLWFWPFIIISFFSSFYFSKKMMPNSKLTILVPFIFLTNTYTFMLFGGGQMGIAIAYSLAPLVLAGFIKHIDSFVLSSQNIKHHPFDKLRTRMLNIKYFLLTGLFLAVQMMFDPRITYITFLPISLYFLTNFAFNNNKKKFILKSFSLLLSILTAVALNSFWIVSLLKHGLPAQDVAKMSPLGFKFLSFADFSNTLSMLHPNWPENIFGKVYFMRPEFIILPLIAYSSLLFVRIKAQNQAEQYTEQRRILFFGLLGLIGAFLAKGTNPPFGQVNEFLFQRFPGMSMFRDPTKFYLLIVLSYSILIPFCLGKILETVSSVEYKVLRKKNNIPNYVMLTSFIVFWLFLIRPAVLGQVGGTFRARNIPQEYVDLKDFLYSQPKFFKTLWFPEKQRFGFTSSLHPAISSSDFFKPASSNDFMKDLEEKSIHEKMKIASILYIIVPFDSEKEIFLEDRKYSQVKYIAAVKKLRSLSWLKEIPSFKEIKVFEVLY